MCQAGLNSSELMFGWHYEEIWSHLWEVFHLDPSAKTYFRGTSSPREADNSHESVLHVVHSTFTSKPFLSILQT